MRSTTASRRDFLVIPVLVVAGLLPFPASAQDDTPSAVEVAKRQNELDFVKKIAQKAALPALQGENKFVLRESYWNGTIEPGKSKLIQVQLYARNDYQFWMAVPSIDAGITLNIYDGEGKIVPGETAQYDETNIASVMVAPEVTGVYYVRIGLKTTIEKPQDWAVIYAYR